MAYATLHDLKVWLDETADTYDNQLRAALVAAERMVDAFLQRSLAPATVSERVYGNGGPYIFPSRTPITAVTSCTVDGRVVAVKHTDISIWRTDMAAFGQRDEIIVAYTAGMTVPEDVKTATLITAQAIFSSADLDANMTGENIAGGVSGGYQPGGPGSIPRAAQTILSPYRRVHHA